MPTPYHSLLKALFQGDSSENIVAAYPLAQTTGSAQRARVTAAERFAQEGAFEHEANRAWLLAGDTRYPCGSFATPSVAELKQTLPQEAGCASTLDIMLWERRAQPGEPDLASIAYLETHADGETVFQLASQFNGLQSIGAYLSPVSAYFDDRTHGSMGGLPAFRGALLRHYAAPDGKGGHFTQTNSRQLNFLADVLPAEIGKMEHGYLMAENIRQPEAFAAKLQQDFGQIRLGVHRDLEVIGSGAQLDQVLTSTLAVGYSDHDPLADTWLTIQRQLLRAAYLGTLLATAGRARAKWS